ncbi:MAG: PAS domain S-box protein [Ignavibacteriaceae bacterium]|jgi:PAS domain S-box-containing protein|nr:PAS domain S-box protein [Ignavibacteriaceae bacterium]
MDYSDKNKENYLKTILELQKENEVLKGQISSSLFENKLNLILENAAEGIFGLDVDGNHTFVNRKAAILLGYEPLDLIGKNSHSIWHYNRPDGSTFPKEECPIYFTLKDGKKHVGESYFWRKDGSGFYVDYSSMPIFDNDLVTGAVITFSDITWRKVVYDEIFRLQRAVESSGEVIFITDLKGLITYVNPEFTNLYGFTADEVIGKATPRILKSGVIAHETYKYFWDTLLNKDVIKSEIINKTKDGRLLNIEGSANPILNDQKEIIGFIGIQHDITSRKRTEEKLVKEQYLFNSLLNNLPDHIYFKDLESRFIRVNNSHAESLGLTNPDQALGKTDFDFHTLAHAHQAYSDEQSIIQTAQPLTKEERLVRTNSPDSWVYATKLPLRNNEGKIIGTFGISRDITKRKQAELALLENERVLNESQKIAGLGSYILDFRTGIWTSSEILDSIFGIDEKYEKTVNGWTELIHPSWRETMSEYLRKDVIENHNKFDKEYKIIRKRDGNERWVYGQGELKFDSNNSLNSMVGTIMDITERKLAEEEIKLKNKLLQTINAEKDKFFSIISHDLRGSLSAFVAATQIITDEINTMELEEIREITSSMKISANNLYSLLENLLEWSKLRRDGMDFVPEKINIKEKIRDCIDVLSESARKKRIEVTFSIPDEMEVFADIHMFDTIFRNLLSNAIKFTHVGGNVNVSANQNSDLSILVKVSDSGIGMTTELKNKLFLISERTGRTGTEGEMSTGLGLLLVKEFIEKHGGKIWVESEVGSGSIFCFTIPEMIKETSPDKLR